MVTPLGENLTPGKAGTENTHIILGDMLSGTALSKAEAPSQNNNQPNSGGGSSGGGGGGSLNGYTIPTLVAGSSGPSSGTAAVAQNGNASTQAPSSSLGGSTGSPTCSEPDPDTIKMFVGQV